MGKQVIVLEYLLKFNCTSKIEFLSFVGCSICLETCKTTVFSIQEYAKIMASLLKGKEGAKGYKTAIDPVSASDQVQCY